MSNQLGLSDEFVLSGFLSTSSGFLAVLRIRDCPAREVRLIPKIANNSGGMPIESASVGLLTIGGFVTAAARSAERIRTLQRTVWNLERLIFLLLSIRIPNGLPVIPRPTTKNEKARSTSVAIHIHSLKEVGRSSPRS